MKIVVLGAGVIGVTSAWYLTLAGHEVTVVDRQDEPGLETVSVRPALRCYHRARHAPE